MVSIWRSLIIRIVFLTLLFVLATGMAADFELSWGPVFCTADDLEMYYIYCKDEISVISNPNNSTKIYVPISENGFAPDVPIFPVSGLKDDVAYCFAVSAWYGDEESGMSNELGVISGFNGEYASSPGSGSIGGSTNNLSGGCFVGALK